MSAKRVGRALGGVESLRDNHGEGRPDLYRVMAQDRKRMADSDKS